MNKRQLITLEWGVERLFSGAGSGGLIIGGKVYHVIARSHGTFDVRLMGNLGELVITVPEKYVPPKEFAAELADELESVEVVLLFRPYINQGFSRVPFIVPYEHASTAEELAALAVAIYRTRGGA